MANTTEILSRKDLGQKIRARRGELDLTQEDLATFAGTSRRLVLDLEAGTRDVKIDAVLSILGALGLEVEIRPRRLG